MPNAEPRRWKTRGRPGTQTTVTAQGRLIYFSRREYDAIEALAAWTDDVGSRGGRVGGGNESAGIAPIGLGQVGQKLDLISMPCFCAPGQGEHAACACDGLNHWRRRREAQPEDRAI